MEDGPGVEDEVHVLVHPLAEGERVPGAVVVGRRPGQRVVDAEECHRDPACAQEGVGGHQVVVRPLRNAHDRVRLVVPDAVADTPQQAPRSGELLRPGLMADVESDDGAGARERRHGGGGRHPQQGVRPDAATQRGNPDVHGAESGAVDGVDLHGVGHVE